MKNITLLLSAIVATGLMFGMYKMLHTDIQESQKVSLPEPTGNYSVGTTLLYLTDESRQEKHNPENKRELVIQVYYPIEKKEYSEKPLLYGFKSVEYINNAIAEMAKIEPSKLDYLKEVHTHSYLNVPISVQQTSYPVLIFSPGFGAPQETYTMLLEELASKGYIVFGINHPYVSNPTVFSDGRVILPSPKFKNMNSPEAKKLAGEEFSVWIEDINFLIEQLNQINSSHTIFKNKLNVEKIGIMGHSFGGRAAIEICRTNDKVKAGVDLDGKLTPEISLDGFNKPFLFIVAERENTVDLEKIKQLSNNMKNNSYVVVLKGAEHGTFSDLVYVFKPWLYKSKLDPLRGVEIIRAYLVAFFDKYLKNKDISFSDIKFEEITLEKSKNEK